MPGLVPGIHGFLSSREKDVYGRDKPGHDESWESCMHVASSYAKLSINTFNLGAHICASRPEAEWPSSLSSRK